MACKCSDDRTPCQKCIGKARDYFNLQFPEIECCHHKHMKITLDTQNAENKELWQIYQDLNKIKLPIKEYINDNSIIGQEIYDRMCDIQDTWFYSRKGESWNSDMVKLILNVRSPQKKLNLFEIDEADFTIIKNEMHFFGSDICNNLNYFTYYFIYDILVIQNMESWQI